MGSGTATNAKGEDEGIMGDAHPGTPWHVHQHTRSDRPEHAATSVARAAGVIEKLAASQRWSPRGIAPAANATASAFAPASPIELSPRESTWRVVDDGGEGTGFGLRG